jgi:Zn-finger nucleic acid-binding protein
MDAHFYAGPGNVVMDSCEVCDLNWLDHGELSRISRAPEYMQPPQYTQSSMSDQ